MKGGYWSNQEVPRDEVNEIQAKVHTEIVFRHFRETTRIVENNWNNKKELELRVIDIIQKT